LGQLHLLSELRAQDPHFTQFYAAPMYLAPSFAGATQHHRVSTNYRNQWPGIASFSTYTFAYDHFFDKFNSGLGVLVLRDVAGVGNLGNLTAGLLYSYDFQIFEEWHVRPGINFSFVQMGIDFHKLRFGDQITSDGTSPTTIEVFPDREQVRGVDVSSSMLIYTQRFWSGFTLDHMLEPNISLLGNEHTIPMKISLFGDTS
jgi:type IX secretion system PorP/SprF family membrane protein